MIGKSGPKTLSKVLSKESWAWAFYDWGNSAFATTVMAGFFPIFFKQYWSSGVSATESTYHLGLANSLASLLLALMAPILGALADASQNKKSFLGFFCLLGVICTAMLYLVGQGQWAWAILFYVLASLGFTAGNIFYDSLIVLVTPKKYLDFVSGFGFSLGYLGGGLLFAVNVVMTLNPQSFGLNDASEAVRLSFLMVSVWWFIFYLPTAIVVKEQRGPTFKIDRLLQQSFKQLKQTFSNIKAHKEIFLFLLAYFFYIDGVNTVIKMAVDYGLSLGFESKNLITALLITQFVGFPAALFFGWLGQAWGARKGIFVAIGGYCLVIISAYFMKEVQEFYIMAAAIGLVQGGIQSLSRSYFAATLPAGQEAEYFGFFNMMGKFSAILGPLFMGLVSLKTQSPRLSILVILLFFIIGAFLLYLQGREQKKKPLPQ